MSNIQNERRRTQMWFNGQKTVEATEPNATIPEKGVFGLPIHQGVPSEAWYSRPRIEFCHRGKTHEEKPASIILSGVYAGAFAFRAVFR
jgi:hypothetical protein